MEKTKKQKVQTHGQGLGRGLAGDMGLNFLFFVFPWIFAVWPKPRENQKRKVQTHGQGLGYPHTNQKTKKTKKQKKPKNQETKKPKKQKKQDCTPQGEGVRCRVLGLVFLVFLFFLFFFVFCFFGFLVFWFFGFLFFWFFGLWIAIADVPSRDCQALSVVALEASRYTTVQQCLL